MSSIAFGNCPQYIQLRDWQVSGERAAAPAAAERKDHLDAAARAMIAAADTFFVASYVDDDAGHRQVDASHRGGKAGFVRIDADGALTIPDFAGNLHFNTLGNFLLNPRAGLTFVDFTTGDMLQMTGEAEVVLDFARNRRVPGCRAAVAVPAAPRRPAPGRAAAALDVSRLVAQFADDGIMG